MAVLVTAATPAASPVEGVQERCGFQRRIPCVEGGDDEDVCFAESGVERAVDDGWLPLSMTRMEK
jgi:hypothetical protein